MRKWKGGEMSGGETHNTEIGVSLLGEALQVLQNNLPLIKGRITP